MKKASRLVTWTAAGAVLTGTGAVTAEHTKAWEGFRLVAYQDVIGVWTACYGETKGVKPGMKFTKEQCDVLFIESLVKHEEGMRKCLKSPDTIPGHSYAAFVSFTYNVGVGNFCSSTLRKMVDLGNIRGACEQLPRWVRAGGKIVRGLVNRRADELTLCLAGVDGPLEVPTS